MEKVGWKIIVLCSVIISLIFAFCTLIFPATAAAQDLLVEKVFLSTRPTQHVHVIAPKKGDKLQLEVWVKNVGDQEARNVFVTAFKSVDEKFTSRDIKLGEARIISLLAGKAQKVTFEVQIPQHEMYFGAWVDYCSAITESDESNNISNRPRNMAKVIPRTTIRSADLCRRIEDDWAGQLIRKEFYRGRVEHDYSPAELIVLSAMENDTNLVTVLVFLEISQQLISQFENGMDLELRFLQAARYGLEEPNWQKWSGFAIQGVSLTYQLQLYKTRDQFTFQEAFDAYFGGEKSWTEFQEIYALYAALFNSLLNTGYPENPGSEGYYSDFRVNDSTKLKAAEAVQAFLSLMNSPLSNEKLFEEEPVSGSVVDYDNPGPFCIY